MRLSDVLLVLHVAVITNESFGAATGWGLKAAAGMSGEQRERRVFNDHHIRQTNPRRTALAFLGRRPQTTTTRTSGGSDAGVAVGSLPDSVAAEMQQVSGSTAEAAAEAAASGEATAMSEPRVSAAQGIFNTFRDFWGNAKDGSVALWTNFQAREEIQHHNQDIRKRVKAGHVMTYAEHAHLERGANDRRKLLQYIIAYSISPKNFVYVVWYVPGLLPSTFEKPHAIRAKYHRLALDRATATLEGISALENQLLKAELALKGKPREAGSRPAKKIEKLEMQREMALQALEAGSKREAFEKFQQHMVIPIPTPPTPEAGAKSGKSKKENKPQKLKLPPACKGVPGVAIKALGKGTGLSGWWHVAPGFYVRYCLHERLRDLGKMDDVLRSVSLESLNEKDLKEACNARAIDVGNRLGGDSDPQELRRSLGEWLELTSAEVAAGSKLGPDTAFLPDRARLLGLGLNCVESSRRGRTAELSRKALLKSW
ncbi:unnamed protein product [Hapterophycus canaliculatus]